MDIVTQGLLGAALSSSFSKPNEMRRAATIGFIAGLAADMDYFIRSADDPLLNIEFHRHFTHALLFIPIGALLVSAILWLFFRNKLAYSRLYLYCLAGFSMSGLLDAFTSYGTYLFWPFYNEPVAFRLVSIVDPIFSLVLLFAVALALIRKQTRIVQIGVMLVGLYLLLAGVQQHRANTSLLALAQQRGHEATRLIVKPSFGNIVLWRGIYEYKDYYYVDAVHVAVQPKIYPGGSIKKYDPEKVFDDGMKSSTLYRDVLRFAKFSNNYLVVHPEQPDVIGDVRYAMLPNSISPLWGITVDTSHLQAHTSLNTFRKLGQQQRQHFIDMLLGH